MAVLVGFLEDSYKEFLGGFVAFWTHHLYTRAWRKLDVVRVVKHLRSRTPALFGPSWWRLLGRILREWRRGRKKRR